MIYEGFIRLMSISHMLSIASTQFFLGCMIFYSAYLIYKKRYAWSDFPYWYYFIPLILFTMVSVFLGVNPKKSLKELFDWWLFFYFITMFLLARKKDILPTIAFYTIVGADIAALYGLYQFVFTNIGRDQARQFKRIEQDIAFEVEGRIGGLLNGKLALYQKGNFLKTCSNTEETQENGDNHPIVFKIVRFDTKEVLAEYSAVMEQRQ